MSKSPIKDYSRLLGQSRTVKKEEHIYKYRYDTSNHIMDDLKMKLELSLKHNAKLLDQNSVLSELVNELRHEVKSLNDQIIQFNLSEQNYLVKSENERNKMIDQLEIKQRNHQFQLEKLLNEISTLHKEKSDLEIIKNKQLESFKIEHQRNMVSYIQGLKNTYNNSKDISQTQAKKLKEVIGNLEHDLQAHSIQRRLEVNRLHENIKNLESQIIHLKHLNHMQIQEMKKTFEAELNHERRGLERQKEVEASNYNVIVKRLKNDIMDKSQEIQSLTKKLSKNEELHSVELQHLKRQKEGLLGDLATAEVHFANNMIREKAKLKEISELELKNVLDLNQTSIDQFRNQVNHLKNLLDCKKQEIRRIYQENLQLKKSFEAQIAQMSSYNKQLKARIKQSERDHLQDFEAFKIKMSQLMDADIKSISSYYQNQINALTISNDQKEKINSSLKQKLYKALQDNDEIRKYFEIQISKQKARVQDLKIKLAAMNLQHKEHMTSLGSKMQMTSMTLVREAEQKQRSQSFFDEQKKKFHSLTNSKDKEITDLMETMHRMKQMHENQLKVLREEKKELRDMVNASEDKVNRIKEQYQEQMKRREQKLKQNQKPEDNKLQTEIRQLFDKNEKIENQNIKLQKQVEHLVRENRSIAQQLGLKKGHIQTLQLQSCAAIQDEKSKLKILMGNNQVSMKDYYEEKIASRQKDNQHLRNVLSQKETDIRDLIVKYNGLEKRIQMLLEAQEKVKDFEEKVKNLGLDNNLVKNIAELFSKGKF